MSILGALAEVVSVTAFLATLLVAAYVICQRSGLNARWNRHVGNDLVVKRPTESPTELYLRRERERRNEWQEADR